MHTIRRTIGAGAFMLAALVALVSFVAVTVAATEPDGAEPTRGADGKDATAALIGLGADGPPITGPPDAVETGRINPVTRISDPAAGAMTDGAFSALGTAYHPLGVAKVRVAIRSLSDNTYWNGRTGQWQADFVEVQATLDDPGQLHVYWSYRLPVDPPDGEYRVRAWAESVTGRGDQLGPLRDFSVRVPAAPLVESSNAIMPVTPLSCDVSRSDDRSSAEVSVSAAPQDKAYRYVFERSRNMGRWYWAGRADLPTTSFVDIDLHTDDEYRYRVRSQSSSQTNSWPITCLAPDAERTAAVNEAVAAFERQRLAEREAANEAADVAQPAEAAVVAQQTTAAEASPAETTSSSAAPSSTAAAAPAATSAATTAESAPAQTARIAETTTTVAETQATVRAEVRSPVAEATATATTTTAPPAPSTTAPTTTAPTTTVPPTTSTTSTTTTSTTTTSTTTTTAAPAPVRRAGTISVTPPGSGVLMGVWAGSSGGGTNDAARRRDIESFEANIARRDMDVAHMFQPLHDQSWKVDRANWMLANGQIPLISWKPGPAGGASAGNGIGQQVVDGRFDDQIRARAREAKRINGPVFSRLFHEMEGGYGRQYDLNPELFVQFWRRVHGIFEAEGANNVIWAWTPAIFQRNFDVSAYYPGDEYVDWIGVDPYLWIGNTQGGSPCKANGNYNAMDGRVGAKFWSFAAAHPDKPVMLGEWGAGYRSNTDERERFIDSVGAMLAQRPQVKALIYFHSNHDQHCRWRLDEGPAAGADAFRRLVNDPRWAVNTRALIDGAR